MSNTMSKEMLRKQAKIIEKRNAKRKKQNEYLSQFDLPYRRIICELLLQPWFDVQCFIIGTPVDIARRLNYTVDHLNKILDEMQSLHYVSVHESYGRYVIILNDDIEESYFSIQ